MSSTVLILGGLLAGLLAAFAALPVLIHLINMMRHRRVKWAAMDFLLQSYKRNRNWIFLKQLLLLLARISVMILLALMLCIAAHFLLQRLSTEVGFRDTTLAGFLGGQPTHHYVLLDDSYSMSDRAGSASAFDRARQMTHGIAARAAGEENQRFTLIRYSRALGSASAESGEVPIDQIADLNAEVIDKDFDELLEQRRSAFECSQLSVGPQAALRVVRQLVAQREEEKAMLYVLTDFRAKDWDNPVEIQKSLDDLKRLDAEVHLVNCVREQRGNLAITMLEPANETRAAGVPLFFNVSVTNYGTDAAQKVQVKVRQIFFDPNDEATGEPEQAKGQADDVLTVLIDEIASGETATRRFEVVFPKPGRHVVEANLQDDPVSDDNRRLCVLDFPEGVPVLVIDNSPTRRNAYYLSAAFEPGRKNTGLRPDIQTAAFLRDANADALARYHAIYLLDVDRLDERAVSNLEYYVRGGGGLAFFVGPEVNIAFYNSNLYRDGEGLFPLPLDRREVLPEQFGEDRLPDIQAKDHPAFQAFLGERNSFLRLVTVAEYIKPPIDWTADDTDVQVAAELRDGNPLAVEHKFGEGRVAAILTTITPDWNNWVGNPTFVVMTLKLQSHLASQQRADESRVVGAPIEVQRDAEKYRSDVTFVVPGDGSIERMVIEKPASKEKPDSPLLTATLGGRNGTQIRSGETDRSGIYEAWSYTTENKAEVQRWAVNVANGEGDLALAETQVLLSKLDAVKPMYIRWDEFDPTPMQQAGFGWAKWILPLIIAVLLCEQVLAYLLSYHPKRGGAR